jgi:prepilin signal peptidase PulO-like enzyme (type II secretory pathway)
MKDLLPLLVFGVLVLVVRLVTGAIQGPRQQERPGVVGVVVGAIMAAAVTWLLSVYLFK